MIHWTHTLNRTAFTLIELLAALSLAVILMIGVLNVIRSLGTANVLASTVNAGRVPAHLVNIVDVMHRDLTCAVTMRYADNRLELFGYSSLDKKTLALSHQPSDVTYYVDPRNGEPLLIRRQTDVLNLTSRNRHMHLVAKGVSRFVLTRPDTGIDGDINVVDEDNEDNDSSVMADDVDSGSDDLSVDTEDRQAGFDIPGPVPDCLQLCIYLGDNEEPSLTRIIIIR